MPKVADELLFTIFALMLSGNVVKDSRGLPLRLPPAKAGVGESRGQGGQGLDIKD
jgi:hypothetical protein